MFFVISGFLITRLLLTELEQTGRINLLRFWARRIRRLLPNAFATLTATILLALLLFPGYDPEQLAREISFAALEFVNFHFADQAVDYFQADGPASPVLHFWSLSVEEQFYMVWPLLLLGLNSLLGIADRRRTLMLLAVIWFVSFTASLVLTVTDQPLAYFGTGTRCWQLGTGALLATGWQYVDRLPGRLRHALAWLGLAAIIGGMVLLDGVQYPGAWALLPTLGTAGLIAGMEAGSSQGLLRRGLSLDFMQWIGERSYSWYLWHWPLLALSRMAYPESSSVAFIAVPVSFAIACVAYRVIEKPVRESRRIASAGALPAFASAIVGLGLVTGLSYLYMPAAMLINQGMAKRITEIQTASQDWPIVAHKCHLDRHMIDQPDCLFGDISAPLRAVLFGDSHAMQWFPPFDEAARRIGWQLRSWSKAACPVADVSVTKAGSRYLECDRWREQQMAKLTGPQHPDLVILSSSVYYKGNTYDRVSGEMLPQEASEEAWREGFRRTIKRLKAAGVEVLVVRDTPRASKNFRNCLLISEVCATPRTYALRFTPLDQQVVREFGDAIAFADFTDAYCNASTCETARRGLIMYADLTHFSATYTASFAPQVTELLNRFRTKLQPASAMVQGGPTTAATAAVAK